MKIKTPAKVKYIKDDSEKFINGKIYNAFFVEYWQGERNSLHVENNDGDITDFNPIEDFIILSDPENLLNDYEATVECVTHNFENQLLEIKFGKNYKAIGRDKDGFYLVMDESFDCYFYPSDYFKNY